MQCHAHQSWTAERVLYLSESAARCRKQLGRRIKVEEFDVVVGSIEARRVGYVEDVQTVLGLNSLSERPVFEDRNVGALLKRAPENISSTGSKDGFQAVTKGSVILTSCGITGWNSVLPRLEDLTVPKGTASIWSLPITYRKVGKEKRTVRPC